MKIIKYTFPLIFTFLGFLIYSNILYAPFIFDDEWFIVENYRIRDISNFLKDFSGTRYVGFLSFAINYYFGGLNTFGYHVVNVVIHIINAMLVYVLVSLTFTALSLRGALAPKPCPEQSEGTREIASALPRNDITSKFIAFSVSILFLVHPIQTQAVSYITQRFTSLAALFYLLALVLYVKARLKVEDKVKFFSTSTLTFYFLSLFSAILAMKTKEISFTLPFIIALYEWTFFREELPLPLRERVGVRGIFSDKIRTRLLYLIPFFLTLLIIPLTLIFGKTTDGFAPAIVR